MLLVDVLILIKEIASLISLKNDAEEEFGLVKSRQLELNGHQQNTQLCSAHFTDGSFETEVALASSMGINRRKRLRPTAVPSLFSSQTKKRTRDSDDTNSHKPTKRLRRAYKKRERSRVRIVHIYTCTQLIKQ